MIVPISTLRNRIQGGDGRASCSACGSISVKVREGQSMKAAEESIRELLRQRHGCSPAPTTTSACAT